jgi:preprotein translocase subunit SecF
LLAQPVLYLALGFSWLLAAFGRLISMLSDAGLTVANFAWLLLELALAVAAIAFALGWLA